jgi:hypothetical protein
MPGLIVFDTQTPPKDEAVLPAGATLTVALSGVRLVRIIPVPADRLKLAVERITPSLSIEIPEPVIVLTPPITVSVGGRSPRKT